MWRQQHGVRGQGRPLRQGHRLLRLRLPVDAVPDVVRVRDDRRLGDRGRVHQLRLRRHPPGRPRPPVLTRAAQVHLSVLARTRRAAAGGLVLPRPVRAGGRSRRRCSTASVTPTPTRASRRATSSSASPIVCALLLFAAAIIRSWVLPAIGLGLLLLTSVLIGGIWPFVMQSFQVKPSEPDKEGPYIARNIEATREAYGVAGTKPENYTAKTTLTRGRAQPGRPSRGSAPACSTRRSSPPAFEQLQQVRGYYAVPETLDVDRYKLGEDASAAGHHHRGARAQPRRACRRRSATGRTTTPSTPTATASSRRAATSAARRVSRCGSRRTSRRPASSEARAGRRASTSARTRRSTRSSAGRRARSPSRSTSRAAVRRQATTPRTPPRTPTTAPVACRSATFFNQTLYAFKFGEPNIVLSSRVNSASQDPLRPSPARPRREGRAVADVDGDVYPAVVDGQVVWIVDGYTTSNYYPYSEHRSLREATDDTLTQGAHDGVADRPGQLHPQLGQGGRRRLRRLGRRCTSGTPRTRS